MASKILFDYYYGAESEQFTFFRVPKVLMQNEHLKDLSSDAKLLYGLMLDRMGLSRKNNWYEDNKAYIHYSVESIMKDMGCSKPTALKMLKELDTSENGKGLIERKRQGQGKPDRIFVKNFVAVIEVDEPEDTDESSGFKVEEDYTGESTEGFTSRGKESLPPEVKNFDNQKSRAFTTRSQESLPPEVKEVAPNNTNINYTDFSDTESNPINLSGESDTDDGWDEMDEVNAYTEYLKQNLEYDWHMQNDSWTDKQYFEEIFNLVRDVVCFKPKNGRILINQRYYPYEIVKAQLLKLDNGHIEYVRECMKKVSSKVGKIDSYLLTALYNAPNTINHYYQQEVQHDMHGGD